MGLCVYRKTATRVEQRRDTGSAAFSPEHHRRIPQAATRVQGPYCVRSVTDTVIRTVRIGVTTSVSIYRVMKVPAGPRPAQLSATSDGEAVLKAAITEAATAAGAMVQSSGGTRSVGEDE